MREKRIISLVLVLVMLCSMTVYGDETTNWYDKAIENAVSNGLYNSSTAKSMANEDLLRAEMAAVINRAFGSTTKASLDNFTDVSKEEWYYDDMAKAVNMGIFKGSEGKLNPKSKITREETFAVLARAIKLTGTDLAVLDKFSDAVKISSWAKQEISSMVTAGYVKGSDSKINPKGNITRAEFAQIMDNLINGYIKSAGTYTSVPSGNVLINTPDVNLKGVTVTGDLIIGDGVGNGEVTLDSVKVIGRTVIRGGGINSIKIIGDSSMSTVVVTRVDGQVRIVVSGGANVQVIEIADGSDDVLLEGTIGSVEVNAAGITVTANNAQISNVNIEAEGAKIAVGASSTVDKIKLDAPKASADIAGTVKYIEATKAAKSAGITTASTAKIENIKTEAAGTTVTGTGKVTKVEANADDVKVDTSNTSVSAGLGTSGVMASGKEVVEGKTITTESSSTNKTSDSSNGGGSSTENVSITDLNAISFSNSNKIKITANIANAGASDTAMIVLEEKSKNVDNIKIKDINIVPIIGKFEPHNIYYAPIVNGKINKTIYELSNSTYNITINVGNVTASAPNPVVVFSPIRTQCSDKFYLESDFDYDGLQGIKFYVLDYNSSIAGAITDYVYNVISTNQFSGAEETLISDEKFDNTQFEALRDSEGCLITCCPYNFFKVGKYVITMQVKSTGPGNPIIGESSFEITVGSTAPKISIDYINECITGYDNSTMEYTKMDTYFGWYTDVDWSVAGSLKKMIDNNNILNDIYCRYKAADPTPASEFKYFSISHRPSAPTGLTTVPTSQGNNGKITLLNSANYQYKLFNADSWSDENIVNTVSEQTYEIDNLAAGTYYVREKASNNSFASYETAITVFENDSTEPSAPKLVSVGLNENSTKIYLKFDKTMSAIGLKKSDFKVYDASGYGGSRNYEISSIGLKQSDSSSIEVTLSGTPSNYPIGIAYTSGTALADDGGVLATFSGRNADNMHLQLSLNQGSEVFYYGTISLSSVEGIGYNNLGLGYIIAADSTAVPDAGTQINTIENIKKLGAWNYPILGNIKANTYLVLYSYDNNTGIINGFGQIEITEDNIGNKCNIIKDNFEPIEKCVENGITKYAISYGTIAETQTVTLSGINASDVTITTISGIQAYVVNTSDIAETGGTKNFTLTLSGDETNGQTNGVYTVKIIIYTPSPILEVDKNDPHRLNVSGANPGAKINLCIIKGGYWSYFKKGIADEYGNTFFEGLEAYNYFVDQTPISGPGNGITSQFTMQVTISD